MKKEKVAVCPGTFDPITAGHVDVIKRAAKIFDKVIIAVNGNPPKDKKPVLPVGVRVKLIREIAKNIGRNIEVDIFRGLLVDYLRKKKVNVVVRGLRAISDFEYEFQMALMNRKLAPDVEVIFLMPSEEYTYLSSSLVKEIISLGGKVGDLLDKNVEEVLRKFLNKRKI
jgi:pantetheine-phosphate adenylyltransferase